MGLLSAASKFGTRFGKNLKNVQPMHIAPDIFFGGLAGITQPGTWEDKVGMGLLSAGGGALGGVGLRSALPGIRGEGGQIMLDMVGSMGGDLGSQMLIGENLQRLRYGGLTPMEEMQAKNVAMIQQQAVADYLRSKGLAS